MPTNWSLLKVGQRVKVDIAELGFQRDGIIKYIGGVNGHYALNHKYYSPSLESGEGLEPWIGVELLKPLPFAQSHSGREYCGRHWFSCNPESGYWCRSHQVSIQKNDPKIIGDLERRKKTTLDLGPILKRDLGRANEIRSFYEPYDAAILTDESDDDYLDKDYDYLKWRESQTNKAIRVSSEVKKWRRLRTADGSRSRSSNKRETNKMAKHKIYRPATYTDIDNTQRLLFNKGRETHLGHASAYVGSSKKYFDKDPEFELNEALETVKRSKEYLRYISHKNDITKASLINSDSPMFGKYLDDLNDKTIAYGEALRRSQDQIGISARAQNELRSSFDRLNIGKRDPLTSRVIYRDIDSLHRKSGNVTFSGPNEFKECASIPVQHSDTFYLDYY